MPDSNALLSIVGDVLGREQELELRHASLMSRSELFAYLARLAAARRDAAQYSSTTSSSIELNAELGEVLTYRFLRGG